MTRMTPTFQRVAALSALLAAVALVVFTGAFAVVVEEGERWALWTAWGALLGLGLVTIPVMVALYSTIGEDEPQLALVATALGVIGALGAATHGAFDLSLLANPVDINTGLPSAIDPRGFMTYGITGLALFVFGWLILRTGRLTPASGWLGLAGGALFVVVFIGRLTALNPKSNAIRLAAVASGFVVVPAFYALMGWTLYRREADAT